MSSSPSSGRGTPRCRPAWPTCSGESRSVTAEGDRRVVFRYTEPYGEQLYDAVFHVAPLPGAPAGLAFRRARWPRPLRPGAGRQRPLSLGPARARRVRRAGGERAVLPRRAGGPTGDLPDGRRCRRTTQHAARGEADATENIPPPRTNVARVSADRNLRVIPVPSPTVGFLLFNQRDPRDRNRPHPILSDRDVRRAIGLALDRRLMVRAVLGNAGEVPYGPASTILWIRHGAPAAGADERARGAAAAGGPRLDRSRRRRRAGPGGPAARPDA